MQRAISLLACAAAALLTASVAIAQSPPVTQTPEAPATTRTVNLTLEQRHIIKELLSDAKVERARIDAKMAIGDPVPADTEVHSLPTLVGQKVPQIKSHRFFVTRQQVVLVEPKENRVAEVIE